MLLSGYDRLLDLSPMQILCQGKSILDLGANVGIQSLKALEHGAKHVTCIDHSSENIAVLKHILPAKKSKIIQTSLAEKGVIKELHQQYNTVFYLAVHQHLERQSKGSGWSLIDEYINMKPEYVAYRAKNYENQGKEYHEKNFGPLIYYSCMTNDLAPLMIFKRR